MSWISTKQTAHQSLAAAAIVNGYRLKAIANEIADPSLRRKPESMHRQALDSRNDTNDLSHWIPAFAGMTVLKPFICYSPGPRRMGI